MSDAVVVAIIAALPGLAGLFVGARTQRQVSRNGNKSKRPTVPDRISTVEYKVDTVLELVAAHIAECRVAPRRRKWFR